MDISGRLVKESNLLSNHLNDINISGLVSGVYMVQAQTKNGILTKQFVKK